MHMHMPTPLVPAAYIGVLQQQRLETGKSPPVQLPPVPLWHPDYDKFVDRKRATYLRLVQHEKIAE